MANNGLDDYVQVGIHFKRIDSYHNAYVDKMDPINVKPSPSYVDSELAPSDAPWGNALD